MPFCDRCNGWSVNLTHHRCPPTWTCEPADSFNYGEGYQQKVIAHDAELAAEKFAENWDSEGDYDILRGREFGVKVTAADGAETFWEVTGESVPNYTAMRRPEDDLNA